MFVAEDFSAEKDNDWAGESRHPAGQSNRSLSHWGKEKGRLEINLRPESEATVVETTSCTQKGDWWTELIAGFDVAVGRPDTLCGWVVGKAALHVETLTEEQVDLS